MNMIDSPMVPQALGIARRTACLCLTPLHVLIVGAIAAHQKSRFSQGWYICNIDSEQNRTYAKRLAACCDETHYIVENGSDGHGFAKYFRIFSRRRRLDRELQRQCRGQFDEVCIPSSLNDCCYLFVSTMAWRQLVTYDDGWLNVQPGSLLTRIKTRWSTRLLHKLTGISFTPEKIREKSSRHYSIYRLENHAHRVMVLDLRGDLTKPDQLKELAPAPKRRVRFLVGPPPEAGAEVYAVIEQFIGNNPIDGVFGHPRDTVRQIKDLPYINTPLIVEDYVLDLLANEPGTVVEIYAYESSVLLNLAHVNNVKTFTLASADPKRASVVAAMLRLGVKSFP